MEIKIEKLDNEGKGIGYINNKIIFVPKTLPNEVIEVEIIKDNKKYYDGKLIKIIKPSEHRVVSKCKYFNECGGCNLLALKYEDTLSYKINKVKEIFNRYLNINIYLDTIKSNNHFHYRNKVTLHINNNQLGLVDEENNILEVNKCLMISNNMNKAIKYIKALNISNGQVLLRENNLGQMIISINTLEKIIIEEPLKNIIGIIYNNKILFGKEYFIENINNFKFKVSYKSFFQINRDITNKLFNLIKDVINEDDNVLDLYCGVGTLGIVSSSKSNKVIGIDNNESNIKDANYNSKLNNIKNAKFILGDSSIFNKYIKADINLIIVDPPRNGLNKKTLANIINYKTSKLIYISCNPFSLARDLKTLLNIYKIEKVTLLDMFPFTHHVECVCVLKRL